MSEIDVDQPKSEPEPRSRRRETLRSIGAGGLAILAGLEIGAAATANARKKKQRKHRRKGKRRKGHNNGHGRGASDPLSFKKVVGTEFTVADGQSADGFADCGDAGQAIAGGLTQTNTKCFLAQSNQVDSELWGLTVTCPSGAGGTTVTPEVICVS